MWQARVCQPRPKFFAHRRCRRRLAPTPPLVPSRHAGCARALTAAVLQTSQQQGTGSQQGASSSAAAAAVAGLATAAAAAVQLWPERAHCEAAPAAASAFRPPGGAEEQPGGWLGWLGSWAPWGGHGAAEPDWLQAVREDPRVAVVFAFALPFLSLSFGFVPSQADMEKGTERCHVGRAGQPLTAHQHALQHPHRAHRACLPAYTPAKPAASSWLLPASRLSTTSLFPLHCSQNHSCQAGGAAPVPPEALGAVGAAVGRRTPGLCTQPRAAAAGGARQQAALCCLWQQQAAKLTARLDWEGCPFWSTCARAAGAGAGCGRAAGAARQPRGLLHTGEGSEEPLLLTVEAAAAL